MQSAARALATRLCTPRLPPPPTAPARSSPAPLLRLALTSSPVLLPSSLEKRGLSLASYGLLFTCPALPPVKIRQSTVDALLAAQDTVDDAERLSEVCWTLAGEKEAAKYANWPAISESGKTGMRADVLAVPDGVEITVSGKDLLITTAAEKKVLLQHAVRIAIIDGKAHRFLYFTAPYLFSVFNRDTFEPGSGRAGDFVTDQGPLSTVRIRSEDYFALQPLASRLSEHLKGDRYAQAIYRAVRAQLEWNKDSGRNDIAHPPIPRELFSNTLKHALRATKLLSLSERVDLSRLISREARYNRC
ncbi:hypothetical protein JCM10207_006310 [Rhodosporidiobolus poonsookiae]